MKRLALGIATLGVVAVSLVPGTALARWNPRKSVEKLVDRVTQVDASISFRNETGKTIVVVLDTDRERHTIAAGGRAVFHSANVGDAPTISVRAKDGKKELFARKLNPLPLKSSLGWNGDKF